MKRKEKLAKKIASKGENTTPTAKRRVTPPNPYTGTRNQGGSAKSTTHSKRKRGKKHNPQSVPSERGKK